MKNYRPVSNRSFLPKVLEKFAMNQLNSHINGSNTSNQYQSAYRKFHSSETKTTKIHNDIPASMDAGKVTALTLLDLSAALDTIDHTILLRRLDDWFGVTGKALDWFKLYLTGRCQSSRLCDCFSSKADLKFGVPQGSVLGPLLFHALHHSIELHDLWTLYPSPSPCWQQPAVCFLCIRGLCGSTEWFTVMFGVCPVMDVDE